MANVKNPHEQGVLALIAVFVDTFVVVTITALVVITVLYTGDGALAQGVYDGIDKNKYGPDRIRQPVRRNWRQRIRRNLPLVLRILHYPELESVRKDQR